MKTDEVQREVYRGWLITINYDDDAESPRCWDNTCTMNCYHRVYSLGDNECKGDPYSDLRELIRENISLKELLRLIAEHSECVKIDSQKSESDYTLYEKYDGEWYICDDYAKGDGDDRLINDAVESLPDHELFEIANNCSELAISNVYAYIHSGITISMSRGGQYSDSFDSGCLGFIYVTKRKMFETFSDLNEENWREKAFERMSVEVATYDKYLTGQRYGWRVYEPIRDGVWDESCPEDGCWGYIGDDEIDYMLVEAKSAIDDYIKRQEDKAAKLEAELNKKRKTVIDNMKYLDGEQFVIGGKAYCVNRDKLFDLPQICIAVTQAGKIVSWKPIGIQGLDSDTVETLYSHTLLNIYQPC